MGSDAGDHAHSRFRRWLTRAWRRQLAKVFHQIYRVRHKAAQYRARYAKYTGDGAAVLLLAASVYLVPSIQTLLEPRFSTEESVQRLQGLLLNTGSALIGAAAIVTSLVLFAMQVNVERLPHGLFRHFSQDRKLLGTFASTFVLAIGVASSSTVAERPWLAIVLISAFWAVLFILYLFLFAYRRALRLINPLGQLQILLDATRKDLRRWGRRADRATPLLESDEEPPAIPPHARPTPNAPRTTFFQINPHWTATAARNVQHAMSIARRNAEHGDLEVVRGAFTAVAGINDAYINAKGRTFYANTPLLEHPLASDAFITETLESLRQFAVWAIGRRDERLIEHSLRALATFVRLYLAIDYANSNSEKSHAHLAAVYLEKTVQKAAPYDMVDVLMEGQRLLGQSARAFVSAGAITNAAGVSDKIAVIAGAACVKKSSCPVTMEGVRQLADLTLYLLRSPSYNASYALGKVRENVSLVATTILKVPDASFPGIHGTTLAPYYSSSESQGLRVQLTELVNAVLAADSDDEAAQNVIRNLAQWADGLHPPIREILCEAIAARSHFTIHMFQWIQGITEILLVASISPACDPHRQVELRSHAGSLVATLDAIPEDEDSVRFVEVFQLTETLFEAALDARRRDCDDSAEGIARLLLTWTFKGGRYMTGWGVLERGLCACAALALSRPEGAVDDFKTAIRQHLASDQAPDQEVLARAAHEIRRRTRPAFGPEYAHSTIDRALAELNDHAVVSLLEEIADMLSPEARAALI